MIPIIVIYLIGFVLFILSIDRDKENQMSDIIYPAMSFFINTIGYYVSYSETDYVTLAYFPLALSIVSLLFLIYRVYQSIVPMIQEQPWEDEDQEEYNKQSIYKASIN